MPEDSTTQCWLFPALKGRALRVQFDEDRGSSDGGVILLKGIDDQLGLTRCLSDGLRDSRDLSRVRHELPDLVMQRVFGIACGYSDGNDAARLSEDPIHKLVLGRDPSEGQALASQPTLSRFENGVTRGETYRMSEALARTVISRHRKRRRGRARLITIDLDQTADLAHGDQQLALFNAYYGNTCYLPLLGFLSFDEEKEQYLFAAILRAGNARDKDGALGLLRRLVPMLKKAFPKAVLRVRLDAGFASPEIYDFLDTHEIQYIVALPKNSVLLRRAEAMMRRQRRKATQSLGSQYEYGEIRYAARSWPYKRRVIIKAQVTCHPGRDPKDNPRFLVTNMPQSPRHLYERVYCARGDVENRIKELHLGLDLGRLSCSRFLANQFRLLLTASAFVLLQELRLRLARTRLARAQSWTLRTRLLKIAVRVTTSVRRVVLHMPTAFPDTGPWRRLALTLGAIPA